MRPFDASSDPEAHPYRWWLRPNSRFGLLEECDVNEPADEVAVISPRPELLDAIFERRSIKVLVAPGPSDAQLDLILRAAVTVPDHGSLRPWRFVVVSGDERDHFAAALVADGLCENPDLSDAARAKLHGKAYVAPTQVVLIFTPQSGNVARWEQEASAASAGYAMTLAAHVLGLGAIWKSAPMRTGPALQALFDLGDDQLLMGWVNLGTAACEPRARRNPPDLGALAGRLTNGRPVGWSTLGP